jgi:hypothetical protein
MTMGVGRAMLHQVPKIPYTGVRYLG